MKDNKSHFWYNKRQRNGILYLSFVIITLQCIYLFVDFSPNNIQNLDNIEVIAFQSKIDSLKAIEIENRKPKTYPFNPSFITDYKGYKLGMSTPEIDRLLKHRKRGKYINSAKQFQEVTNISDSLLNKLKPYFKFPDWINPKKTTYKNTLPFKGIKKNINKASNNELQQINGIGTTLSARIIKFKTSIGGFNNKAQLEKVYGLKPEVISRILERFYIQSDISKTLKPSIIKDLNIATATELQSVNGIGEKLSTRIVKFRNKIGGFHFNDQLSEVYGLKAEVISRLFKKFKIISKPKIQQINVNEATFKEILHLPYIDYNLTKKIFEYRDEFAEIQNIQELKKIDGFPLDKFDRIILYLKAE